MLVLTRKEGEQIVIGDNLTIVVKKISGGRVTLGIVAPEGIKILRGELYEKQQKFRESEELPSLDEAMTHTDPLPIE